MDCLYYPDKHVAAEYMKNVLMDAHAHLDQSRQITIRYKGKLPTPLQVLAETISEVIRCHELNTSNPNINSSFIEFSGLPLNYDVAPITHFTAKNSHIHLTATCVKNLAKVFGLKLKNNAHEDAAAFKVKLSPEKALSILSCEIEKVTRKTLYEMGAAENQLTQEISHMERELSISKSHLPLKEENFTFEKKLTLMRDQLPSSSILKAISNFCDLSDPPLLLVIKDLGFLGGLAFRSCLCTALRNAGIKAFLPTKLTKTEYFRAPFQDDFQWDADRGELILGTSFTNLIFNISIRKKGIYSEELAISMRDLPLEEQVSFASFTHAYTSLTETRSAQRFQAATIYKFNLQQRKRRAPLLKEELNSKIAKYPERNVASSSSDP